MTTDIDTFIMYITPFVLRHGGEEDVKYQLKKFLKENMEDNDRMKKEIPELFEKLIELNKNNNNNYSNEMAIATEEKNCIIEQSDALGKKIATLYTKDGDELHLGVFEDSKATLSILENGVSKDEVIKLMTSGKIPYVDIMRKA